MKIVKDYMMKLGFVFKEIFKAGPSVFFLSVSSMVIAGISPVLIRDVNVPIRLYEYSDIFAYNPRIPCVYRCFYVFKNLCRWCTSE